MKKRNLMILFAVFMMDMEINPIHGTPIFTYFGGFSGFPIKPRGLLAYLAKPCSQNGFHCGDDQCIPGRYRCDGEKDCSNNRDEEDCPFCCGNGECIPLDQHCDTIQQCSNNKDEEDCEFCWSSGFNCGNGKCLPDYERCDGIKQCSNDKDEEDCGPWSCGNGESILSYQRCDRILQCSNNKDEEYCENSPLRMPVYEPKSHHVSASHVGCPTCEGKCKELDYNSCACMEQDLSSCACKLNIKCLFRRH